MAICTKLVFNNARSVLLSGVRIPSFIPCASLKLYPVPPDFKDIELPERKKLPLLDRIPTFPMGIKPPKSQKRLIDIRGPELVHNQLIYKQYGVIALCGGNLKAGHIDMIRLTINRNMDVKRTFAVWRIDPPWKPRTKKGQGKRMGGGKGPIDHYVTPVKAGRIIVEVGGAVEFEEVQGYLQQVCHCLPFDAMVVSQKILEDLKVEEEQLKRDNVNPFTYEYAVKNNLQACLSFLSYYDKWWYGKYI